MHRWTIQGVAALMAGLAAAQSATPAMEAQGKEGRIRVQLAARNEVEVSSEIAAKIAQLDLREGDPFHAGQTLVAFDCSLYAAQLHKAEATLDAAKQLSSVNQRLSELHSVGALEVQQAEAKVKEGSAEVAYMRSTVGKCAIAAPFSGRVSKRYASAQQYATPGKPILQILDTGNLEVQMIVPSKWLTWLKPGAHFQVQVDELGRQYPAKVTRLGARIDPVSQSLPVTAEIDTKAPELLPGMSGFAVFANQP